MARQRAYIGQLAESGLKPTDRLVAAAIATFADANGVCWPSDRKLSRVTGLAERSHAAIRRRLIAAGKLERIVYGHGRRNQYRLVLDSATPADDELGDDDCFEVVDKTRLRAQPGAQSTMHNRTNCTLSLAGMCAPGGAPLPR